jgi:hypothetical protein
MSTTQDPTTARPADAFGTTAFDPMAAWTASQEAFHKMLTDSHARAKAFADEYATLEAQMIARAQAAIASWAQLAQDAIAYGAQLSQQARKVGLEVARKAGVTGA